MKVVLVLLALLVVLSSGQQTYNPGTTIMVKDWLIFKIKDIIIPDIMAEFENITIPDIIYNETYYELMLYDMEAEVTPLEEDNITIMTDGVQNTLTVGIHGFEMEFFGMAMARIGYFPVHGSASIKVGIKNLSFTIIPKLRADGAKNAFDYDMTGFDFQLGEIRVDHIHLGYIPEAVLKLLINTVLEVFTFVFDEFSGVLDKIVIKVIDTYKVKIPDSVAIQGTPFSVSLSFPDIIHFRADRIEVPVDGTLYVTQDGYNPSADSKTPIPYFEPSDPNNLQLHLHEYVINTALAAFSKTGYFMGIDSSMLAPLKLPVNVLTTTWIGHLFPRTLCKYAKDKDMTIHATIANHDGSSLHFAKGRIYGDLIPSFTFYVGAEAAFTFDLTLNLDVNLKFQTAGKDSVITGSVNKVSLSNPTFTALVVDKSDLPDIINKFEPMAEGIVTDAIDKILSAGYTIQVLDLFQNVFDVQLDTVMVDLEDQYLEVSFTIDVEEM